MGWNPYARSAFIQSNFHQPQPHIYFDNRRCCDATAQLLGLSVLCDYPSAGDAVRLSQHGIQFTGFAASGSDPRGRHTLPQLRAPAGALRRSIADLTDFRRRGIAAAAI